ncbi:hypothetical protein KDL44_15930 [bacterium]|nr:hypothetical protein [bacterium]
MMFLRKQLPIILAFVIGLGLWLQAYIPHRTSSAGLTTFTQSWAVILAGCALLLGILSAVHHHWTKIKLRRQGFAYSIITLGAFVVTLVAGLSWWNWPGFGAAKMADGSLFTWIFDNVFTPLAATMFSLLAFFIASAAFRAFRARSFEATALLIAGCIVMLGRVPIGELIPLGGGHDLSDVAGWIMNVPNAAAQRAILVGVILSQVAISIRIIFGIERTYMGGSD